MIFSTAFSVLFPLFAKIALGFGIRNAGLLSESTLRQVNNLIFRIFIPTLLFTNIYQTDFSTITSFRLLWFSVLSILVMNAFFMVFIPMIEPENRKRGVMVQGICRSNFIFFGMPMAVALFGGASAGLASLMVGVVVPMVNVTSVVALEYFRKKTPNVGMIIKGILLNPIVIGGLLGLAFSLASIRLPVIVERFLVEIAGIATPLALIILGSSVTFTSVKANRKSLILAVAGKLLIVPAVGVTLSILAGFRGLELILLMSMFASPAAVSSYTMAQQMDGDADLAGQIVVFTTAFSLFTLFFWITTLMALGYF
ncbi:MAG: AEC family transporter [Sphaerochaeta sp.]|jgi:predicted permease|nr:AEC family transporter [Sphaerochaeta sp.]NCC12101.1 AEC family transporter [Spirochaetia bacterium]NCC89201.1 AEC family transporter [Spirochaetia bacterium]